MPCARPSATTRELADAWLHLAKLLAASGDMAGALDACTRATTADPDYGEAWVLLAGLHLDQGRPERAVAACRNALAVEPENAPALSLLGTAQQLTGNLREAAACFERAVALQPDSTDDHYKLACAYQALGELEPAREQFERTLALDAGSATAIGGLVRVHEQRGDEAAVKRLLPALLDAADRNPLVLPTLAAVAPGAGVEDSGAGKTAACLVRNDAAGQHQVAPALGGRPAVRPPARRRRRVRTPLAIQDACRRAL